VGYGFHGLIAGIAQKLIVFFKLKETSVPESAEFQPFDLRALRKILDVSGVFKRLAAAKGNSCACASGY
jgi:hypothetical protein